VIHNGYVFEAAPGHPKATKWGFVQQHRLVAEYWLGRLLLPREVVHHEDRDKLNNDPWNLWLFPSQAEHQAHHKRDSPRYSKNLAARLRRIARDPRRSRQDAAEELGLSLGTIDAIREQHQIEWVSASVRELSARSVRAALRGRSLQDAASLLSVHPQTIRNRFPELLETRASPGILDAHKEEIRSLATHTRADDLGRRYGVNPETVKNAIRRWAASEPDAWSDVRAFQLSRRGIR